MEPTQFMLRVQDELNELELDFPEVKIMFKLGYFMRRTRLNTSRAQAFEAKRVKLNEF